MDVLVIGGSGNLSTDVVIQLRDGGHDVSVLTRGQRPLVEGVRAIVADRDDEAAMARALRKVDVDAVVNFLGFDIPQLQTDINILGHRISQYIFVSSATVYAKPHEHLPLTERTKTGNRYSEYAQKKLACEEWLRARERSAAVPVTIVRPSHTFSPRWVPNLVSSAGYTFADRLIRGRPVFVPDDGDIPWALTASSDFATGLCGLVGNERAIGETFHITTDEALTWNEIYSLTAEAFGAEDPQILGIPTDFVCASNPEMTAKLRGDKAEPGIFDNRKIRDVVRGFRCRKTFAEAIQESAAWFAESADRRTVDPAVDALFDSIVADWRQFNG